MQQLKKRGVTIVLVSHSNTSVMQICERAIWLHNGRMMGHGPSKKVIKDYLAFLENKEKLKQKKLHKKMVKHVEKQLARREHKRPLSQEAAEGLYGPIYDEEDRKKDRRTHRTA